MNDAELQRLQHCAKQWAWQRMDSRERIDASLALLGNKPRSALLGMFSWGPANPGTLGKDDELELLAWVRHDPRRASWLDISPFYRSELVSESLGRLDAALPGGCSRGPHDDGCSPKLACFFEMRWTP